MKISYELIRFTDCSENFYKALKIYNQVIPYEQKTNSNEITKLVQGEAKKFRKGDLFFFGLLSNKQIIGYAEIAYMKDARILIIDYITLDERYKSNSAFYSFYSLIINYFDKLYLDYDFITKEILCKFEEQHIQKEEINLYEHENFKVVNACYIQPQLEEKNIESSKESLLMIYQRASSIKHLKKDAYINIISVIYDYYYEWAVLVLDSDEEKLRNLNLMNENLKKISESINDDQVVLNGYPFKYSTSSDKALPTAEPKSHLLFATILIIVFVVLLIVLILVLHRLDIKINILWLTLILIGLYILILCFLDKSFAKMISKIRLKFGLGPFE